MRHETIKEKRSAENENLRNAIDVLKMYDTQGVMYHTHGAGRKAFQDYFDLTDTGLKIAFVTSLENR